MQQAGGSRVPAGRTTLKTTHRQHAIGRQRTLEPWPHIPGRGPERAEAGHLAVPQGGLRDHGRGDPDLDFLYLYLFSVDIVFNGIVITWMMPPVWCGMPDARPT
jgi:hypothetical protein